MNKLISLYLNVQSRMQSMVKNEKGATMVEYALMVALIAVALIGTVTALKGGIGTAFDTAKTSLAP